MILRSKENLKRETQGNFIKFESKAAILGGTMVFSILQKKISDLTDVTEQGKVFMHLATSKDSSIVSQIKRKT